MGLNSPALLAAIALFASMPAAADQAMILGTQTDRMCKKFYNDYYGAGAPSETWMGQCRTFAAEQDACVRSNGGPQKASPQTTACWTTFQARVRSIPNQ